MGAEGNRYPIHLPPLYPSKVWGQEDEVDDVGVCALEGRGGPHLRYRGTSLTRTPPPVGPYSSMCLGSYGGPEGGGCFL